MNNCMPYLFWFLLSYSCYLIVVAGDTCREDIDDCTPTHECRNGATCIDALNGYTCQCRPGWQGRLCSQEVNECMSQPCANGGICTDALNGFTCECTSNFGGATCTEDINECLTRQPCRNYVLCDNTFGGYNCVCLPGPYHISQTGILRSFIFNNSLYQLQ